MVNYGIFWEEKSPELTQLFTKRTARFVYMHSYFATSRSIPANILRDSTGFLGKKNKRCGSPAQQTKIPPVKDPVPTEFKFCIFFRTNVSISVIPFDNRWFHFVNSRGCEKIHEYHQGGLNRSVLCKTKFLLSTAIPAVLTLRKVEMRLLQEKQF